MGHQNQLLNPIYKSTKETLISPKNTKPILRTATFLKPYAQTTPQTNLIPNTPSLHELFTQTPQHWPNKITFKDWKYPLKNWQKWIEKLAATHANTWQKVGICDAIMSSIYELKCNQNVVLGLCEFWCIETNSFVFPWGEASVTLEDVMVLGGLPLLGENVECSLSWEMVNIVEELSKQRWFLSKRKGRRRFDYDWMKYFMENESEFEHVAFLYLWLSRYVFPSNNDDVIGNNVFKIAIYLSQGKKIALGYAVLASLYCNLRLLKEQASGVSESIVVSGHFQLLQLWGFEHFPLLGKPNVLKPGEPRVARWHKKYSKVDNIQIIRSIIKLGENFEWRPYAADVENWRQLAYYEEDEQFLSDNSGLDEELQSFVRCLCACELVGMDCREKYMPYRVAMQFGLDQDLPGEFPGFDFGLEGVGFFVPRRGLEPGVSERYFNRWNECKRIHEEAIRGILVQESSLKVHSNDVLGVNDPKSCEGPAQVHAESELKDSRSFASNKCRCRDVCECEASLDDSSLSCRLQTKALNRSLADYDVTAPAREEKTQRECRTSFVSNGLKNSHNIAKFAMKPNNQDMHASNTLESLSILKKHVNQDFRYEDNDSRPAQTKCSTDSGIRSHSLEAHADCNSNGNNRKRKFAFRTKQSIEVTDHANDQYRVSKEMTGKAHRSFKDTLIIENDCERNQEPIASKQIGTPEFVERREAGDSLSAPIVVDDDMERHEDRNRNSELEKRLLRIEKRLGMFPVED